MIRYRSTNIITCRLLRQTNIKFLHKCACFSVTKTDEQGHSGYTINEAGVTSIRDPEPDPSFRIAYRIRLSSID